MEASSRTYSFASSLDRLDDILGQPAGSFTEADSLPSRDSLTYSNGYYANCSAIFVDIRRSSKLPEKYKRPALARIYRAFISEIVAVFTSHSQVREVNIVGDCVWAVIDSPLKNHVDELFDVAGRANSLREILNYKMGKKGYDEPIHIGIGIDYGRALMIKAGYSGSGISDVVYMGDVVNSAAHLAGKGDSGLWLSPATICLSAVIESNLKDEYRQFCRYDATRGCYVANVIDLGMNQWLKEQG